MLGPETEWEETAPDVPEVDEVEQLITHMNDKLTFLGGGNSVPSHLNVSYASKRNGSVSSSMGRASDAGFNDYNDPISPLRKKPVGSKSGTTALPYGGQPRRGGKAPAAVSR